MAEQNDVDTLISCKNVGKVFCRDLKKSMWYGARDIFRTIRGRKKNSQDQKLSHINIRQLREGEFWANRDISFSLNRGECLGLIGRNGAGKTTLLKMLNGIIKPDTGQISIKGRLGSLIALGAGFNPILTGRENIVANAMVLGLSPKQIKDQIDDIIDFADLREFIDSPVRNYSSGMQVRLGFAIATVINPDVLILDEVLAVGDASFRHKCYNRINNLIKRSAVILVSHSMDYISQLATSVGVLNRGEMTLYHDPLEAISVYNNMITDDAAESAHSSDGGKVEAYYYPVTAIEVQVPESVNYADSLQIKVSLTLAEPIYDVTFSFNAINRSEQTVMAVDTSESHPKIDLSKGKQELQFSISPLMLHAGDYKWCFHILKRGSIEHIVWYMRAGAFTVSRIGKALGDIPYIPLAGELRITIL
jgi:lipopolysaccharide transport system ATP-binding protein